MQSHKVNNNQKKHDLFFTALGEFGTKEVVASRFNPEVAKYFVASGISKFDKGTSWCGAFMGYICKKNSLEIPENPGIARNWLKVGRPVGEPAIGDVVVFWRNNPDSWQGHVTLFVNQDTDYVYCLGGNQSDRVQISKYPKSRLLGYRSLIEK